jgi:transcriptional regulator with XRE-family HTH domain
MGRHQRTIPVQKTEGHRLFAAFIDGANQAEIARLTGVSRETIRKLADGSVGPGIELALKVEAVSYGKVPIASWVQPAKGQAA